MKLKSMKYCKSNDSTLMSLQMQLADPETEETLMMTEIGTRGVESECKFWTIKDFNSTFVTAITIYYSDLEFI